MGGTQCGEREADIEQAQRHARAAVAELELTAQVRPVPADEPGAYTCELLRDGRPVEQGLGCGKGNPATAKVGAMFEALEHHLSHLPPPTAVQVRPAHGLGHGLPPDTVLSLLERGPNQPLGCLPYRNLISGVERDLPIFACTPHYLKDHLTQTRAELGDRYDYRVVRRYSFNNGWAAGTTPVEAAVHAINEIIERDAISLLLIDRFLTPAPAPTRVVRPATLPDTLAGLHHRAQDLLHAPVHLIDMTSDLGVPAFWAHTPAPPGQPARMRGYGASVSAHYAAERALTELIQCHSLLTEHSDQDLLRNREVETTHPALHRCYLADITSGPTTPTTFTETPAPTTPTEHLDILLDQLNQAGLTAWVWHRHTTDHLAVLNITIPGTQRFMLITEGHLVLPGPRRRPLT
ncbi:hypothetical protein ALI144C_06790 [Actinosynnema sp. ALI-1.44]|nr:hypothetical protein ALI144C_06790 [Actinosynnema sp. ALI-1.44]